MTVGIDMVMDGYYVKDRLQEIWDQLNVLHLSYLELEESPQKLEQRNKLEDCIKEFLCLTPHNRKFMFRETAEVLHRSASTKKDFSGYRAALGWNAIGTYAANLLSQPWRKEYRQIKMYSGFYKHEIEANLVGAEIMFESMGYKHDGDGILTFDGPICPDRVVSVSQDSLVAYVECQILKQIWEEVSKSFKISWLEVLEFRETHLCSPKQSVQALNYRFHERQYQQHTRSYSQGTDPFTSAARFSTNLHTTSTPSIPMNHSFPPLHSHTNLNPPVPVAPQYIYGNNGYYANSYATYAPAPLVPQHYHPYSMPISQHVLKPPYHANYCCQNGYAVPPHQGYMCPSIPTAQLIEVDTQNSNYDVPDGAGHSRSTRLHGRQSADYYNVKTDKNIPKDGFKGDVTPESVESWDYVYRNLESQGYSKDLGERGDVLSPPLDRSKKSSIKEAKTVKATALDDVMYNMNLHERTPKISEALQKYKEHEVHVPDLKNESRLSDVNSSYDNLSSQEISSKRLSGKVVQNGTSKTKPIVHEKNILSDKAEASVSNKTAPIKNLDSKKAKSNEKPKLKEKDVRNTVTDLRETNLLQTNKSVDKWQCCFCTYLNEATVAICEMCGKSKTVVQETMEVGGSQCPQCTLVNKKDCKVCEACGTSLKNSPTYI